MLCQFTDQLDKVISINYPARRIVSIVPSQTELLFDLGLNEEVIGITKFCVHPENRFKAHIKVGGTKKLNLDLIRSLNPDLIIGNKEENLKRDIALLQEEFPVWMSNIYTLEDAMRTISAIAALVDRQPEAAYLSHLIRDGFRDLQTLALQQKIDKTVAFLIWKDPYMLAGRNTFINDILFKIGLTNITKESRYPEVTIEELAVLKPDLIFLSSEPFPFRDKHLQELKSVIPDSKVMLVDGEMFSWYGSRLVKSVEYLFKLQKEIAP